MATQPVQARVPGTPKPGRKYFSVEEANKSLPYVSRVIQDITNCYRRASQIRQRLELPQPGDDMDELRQHFDSAMDELQTLTDELSHVGVELKDYERGLIDFPAIHAGREIYLCWHSGEKRICAWHEIDAGFAGRQDVSLLIEPASR